VNLEDFNRIKVGQKIYYTFTNDIRMGRRIVSPVTTQTTCECVVTGKHEVLTESNFITGEDKCDRVLDVKGAPDQRYMWNKSCCAFSLHAPKMKKEYTLTRYRHYFIGKRDDKLMYQESDMDWELFLKFLGPTWLGNQGVIFVRTEVLETLTHVVEV
jgi:hypothetical protein